MSKQSVSTNSAPKPAGPYSQGIKVNNLLFVSGQGPFDPKTGKMVGEEIAPQTLQALKNIRAIIEASGLTMRDVVMVSVFLRDQKDFAGMNETYKTFFSSEPPTRTTVVAGFVVPGMLIEVNAIACRE